MPTRDARQVLLVGSSHAEVIANAYAELGRSDLFRLRPILLHDPRYQPWGVWDGDTFSVNPILIADIRRIIKRNAPAHVTMKIGGSSYFELGSVNNPRLFDFVIPGQEDVPLIAGAELVPYDLVRRTFYREEVAIMQPLFEAKRLMNSVSCLIPPPPIADAAAIFSFLPDEWREDARRLGVPTPDFRRKVWQVYASVVEDICREAGIAVLRSPGFTLDGDGFLKPEFSEDTLHGNANYGAAVLEQIAALIDAEARVAA